MDLCCKKYPLHTRVKRQKNESGMRLASRLSLVVEARGIEPLSENHLPKLSTSVSNYLTFPHLTANWKAERIGSLWVMIKWKASLDSRAPLIDISIQAVVLLNETAALIRLRTQLVCCRLILKIRRFQWVRTTTRLLRFTIPVETFTPPYRAIGDILSIFFFHSTFNITFGSLSG